MANGNKYGELLRNKGIAMETIEDPAVVAATERDTSASPTSSSSSTNREDRIREAAYAAAERRGFEPGHETDDWLAAEREIDSAASPTEVQAREGTRGV